MRKAVKKPVVKSLKKSKKPKKGVSWAGGPGKKDSGGVKIK